MKRIAIAWLIGLALTVGSLASDLTWLTDLNQAKALAKKENKMVLMNFTGSDWCGFCIKLHKEVFSTREFADYAVKNLVLLELDFPNRKAQSDALKQTNNKLKDQYKEGFPTLVFLDSSGKQLGVEVGYGGGGPKPFLAKVEAFRKK